MTADSATPESGPEAVAALIETLFATEQRLEELTAGEVDSVAGRDGRVFLLGRAQEQLRRNESSRAAVAAQALQQQQVELRVLFDLMPAMLWFKDTQNRILRVNKRVADLAGMSVEAMEGHSLVDFYPAEAAKYYADDLEVIGSGAPRLGIVEVLRGSDGGELWVETDKVPVCDKDGAVTGIIVMAQDITERKRAETALRDSELRLRFLNEVAEATRPLADPERILEVVSRLLGQHLNASRCAYADVDRDGEHFSVFYDYTDGCASSVGHYALSSFGAEVADGLRKGRTLILRDVDRESLEGAASFKAAGIRAIISSPLVKDGELRALMAVHQTTPRDWTAGEVSIVEEVVERCWATMERRSAEAQLRESEGLRRIAARASRLGGWTVDFPEVRINWSDEVCAIHDLPAGTVPGLEQAMSFYAPDSRRLLAAAFAACKEHGAPYDLELEIVTASGRNAWVRAIGEAHRNAAGAITRVQGAFQDISERKRGELEIARSEERFGKVFHSRLVAIGITEAASGRLIDANEKFIEFFGYERDEMIGRTAVELQLWGDLADRDRFVAAFAAGDPHTSLEGAYRRKSGELRHGMISTEAMTLAGIPEPLKISVLVDLTDRKRLEAQLMQAQKMEAVGRLAGGIAHDFNNMLGVITGYSELLLGDLGSKRVAERVEEIQKAAERAAGLTRQLLAFSRQQVLLPRVLDLNEVVEDVGRMLRRLIGEDIQFVRMPGNGLGRIRADPGQVEQVLMNLVVNARDAMPQGGGVTLATTNVVLDEAYVRLHPGVVPGDFVKLSVSDTGEGMDAATQARIFEPFFTTKEPGKGTGLGLATVFGIVKQSGGHIGVHSELGVGTTFSIYFPRVEDALPETKAVPGPAPTARGTEAILLVEDADSLRVMIREILEGAGYAVTEYSDPEEALVRVSTDTPSLQLLLTDVVMPLMSGRELARGVRVALPDVKVLFMSGYSDAVGVDTALASGTGFLQKPFTMEALLRKIRAMLDGSLDG